MRDKILGAAFMVYAFGYIPLRNNDELLNFIESDEDIFVLPEGFLGISNMDASKLAVLTEDNKRVIVSGTDPHNTDSAILFWDGMSIPISYPSMTYEIPLGNRDIHVDIRTGKDIMRPYSPDFDVLLHSSSIVLKVLFSLCDYPSVLNSTPIVSSDYREGSIRIGGREAGHLRTTDDHIKYRYLDPLDLQRYL